ncbi:MAG: M28 family peptidase, partial [Cytophagaceae bacterium]
QITNYKSFFLISLIALTLMGCPGKEKPKEKVTSQERVPAPVFNADSAYEFVNAQVKFGPRVPNTASHIKCGDFLIAALKKTGAKVTVQTFEANAYDGKKLFLRNIIASINTDAPKRIIFAAHWDTRPFADQDPDKSYYKKPIDGANDGGSGVGILLEVARAINTFKSKPGVGLDLILFDGEDYGAPEEFEGSHANTYCLGSQYWAKNPHGNAYYGILLDMVGAKNATFAKEGLSMQYAGSIVDKVWQTGHSLGYSSYFIFRETGAITDDHAYVNEFAKIPMIDIIEFKGGGENYFGSYWHTHNDNMDVIDKNTLKAVGQTLLEVVYNEKQ